MNGNLDTNNTINEIPADEDDDEPFEFDDSDSNPRGDNPFFFYVLEYLASVWQLISGAFEVIFGTNSSTGS